VRVEEIFNSELDADGKHDLLDLHNLNALCAAAHDDVDLVLPARESV